MPKLRPDPRCFLTPAHREPGPESSSSDRQPDELSYAEGRVHSSDLAECTLDFPTGWLEHSC